MSEICHQLTLIVGASVTLLQVASSPGYVDQHQRSPYNLKHLACIYPILEQLVKFSTTALLSTNQRPLEDYSVCSSHLTGEIDFGNIIQGQVARTFHHELGGNMLQYCIQFYINFMGLLVRQKSGLLELYYKSGDLERFTLFTVFLAMKI